MGEYSENTLRVVSKLCPRPVATALRRQLPLLEQVVADTEFLGDLCYWLFGADKFHRLAFELRTVSLLGLMSHLDHF